MTLFVVKFDFFFRNLASLTSFLTALGKNVIEEADYCQKKNDWLKNFCVPRGFDVQNSDVLTEFN